MDNPVFQTLQAMRDIAVEQGYSEAVVSGFERMLQLAIGIFGG